jgi:hypothetical protein
LISPPEGSFRHRPDLESIGNFVANAKINGSLK